MAEAFPSLFRFNVKLSLLEFVIDSWVTEQNVNEFSPSPLKAVGEAIKWCYKSAIYATEEYQLGKTLVRKLISLGASIHYRDGNYWSLLESLITSIDDPFESRFLGDFWLDALSQAGVDILKYIQVEIPTPKETPFFYREIEWVPLYTLQKPFMMFWDWYNNPLGPAFDVLEEFKYFERSRTYFGRSEKYNWPFIFPDWHWSSQDDQRFKRQQLKKTAKLTRAQGLSRKRPRMPGAWIH
jgi:hypothetical protein